MEWSNLAPPEQFAFRFLLMGPEQKHLETPDVAVRGGKESNQTTEHTYSVPIWAVVSLRKSFVEQTYLHILVWLTGANGFGELSDNFMERDHYRHTPLTKTAILPQRS